MNSSLEIQDPSSCVDYGFIGGKPVHFSTLSYTILVAIIIIHATTCPFTIVLNLLVLIAVKTKARLQSNSNIALACLASTDVMVGFIIQPLHVLLLIIILNSKLTGWACVIPIATRFFTNFFCFSSVVHLLLMSGDRYVAIKHPYIYIQTVTKARVLTASAIAWILTVGIHITFLIDKELFMAINSSLIIVFIAIFVLCNAIIYRETRRHQQQIAAQQVTVEARENFARQKRALKLTVIIAAVVILSYLPHPVISLRKIKDPLKDITSVDTMCAIHMATAALAVINSFVNPLIYCVRLRQFRVAFIELLFRKDQNQAEEFEKKIFGSNAVANVETNRGGEREEQDVINANVIIEIETFQGGVRKEQDVIHANAIIGIQTFQGGEREEQDVIHANAIRDIETNQGGEIETEV